MTHPADPFPQEKCFQYWPDQGCWTYGHIRVCVEDCVALVDYTVRKFCVQSVRGPRVELGAEDVGTLDTVPHTHTTHTQSPQHRVTQYPQPTTLGHTTHLMTTWSYNMWSHIRGSTTPQGHTHTPS